MVNFELAKDGTMISNTPPGANQDPRAPWLNDEEDEVIELAEIEDLNEDFVKVKIYTQKRGLLEADIDKEDLIELALKKLEK